MLWPCSWRKEAKQYLIHCLHLTISCSYHNRGRQITCQFYMPLCQYNSDSCTIYQHAQVFNHQLELASYWRSFSCKHTKTQRNKISKKKIQRITCKLKLNIVIKKVLKGPTCINSFSKELLTENIADPNTGQCLFQAWNKIRYY